ncbi:MAG: urea ABC transporter ATP-binding protein UrtD [Pseudomonadota bacterium]
MIDSRAGEAPTDVNSSQRVLLQLDEVSVRFDGFKALTDLSLSIDDGELRCIIGPNGAGKTTFMDVVTGKTRPDAGQVCFDQRVNLLERSEHEIVELGISRKFQQPSVFEDQSVRDNLSLAYRSVDGRSAKSVWSALRYRERAEDADAIDALTAQIGLKDHRTQKAGDLAHGQKQWLEIGLLLAQQPRLLLIDEPVAGMTQAEVDRTAELLTTLAGDRTVVVVEHDMAFIRTIARTVTVLHEGRVLAEGSMTAVQNNPAVRRVYLGNDGGDASIDAPTGPKAS